MLFPSVLDISLPSLPPRVSLLRSPRPRLLQPSHVFLSHPSGFLPCLSLITCFSSFPASYVSLPCLSPSMFHSLASPLITSPYLSFTLQDFLPLLSPICIFFWISFYLYLLYLSVMSLGILLPSHILFSPFKNLSPTSLTPLVKLLDSLSLKSFPLNQCYFPCIFLHSSFSHLLTLPLSPSSSTVPLVIV